MIFPFRRPHFGCVIKVMHLLTMLCFAFVFSEMDLLLVPYWADRELDLVQWPPFLLASKVMSFSFLFYFRSQTCWIGKRICSVVWH